MAVRVLPCANVVVVINDDKQHQLTEDGAVEHEAELQSRLLRLVSAMRTCLSSRAACDAFVVFVVGCALVFVLSITQVSRSEPFDVESLDVDSAVHLGQIVLFLGAYVGCWVVLSRMSRWIDTA